MSYALGAAIGLARVAGGQIAVEFSISPGWRNMAAKHVYKIIFLNQGKLYEIYARKVGHGELFGFIEVEGFVFGERSAVVVDPSEERIKSEFAGVERSFLPLHSVIRIDQVPKQGVSKIMPVEGGNVSQFPMPVYTPGGDSGSKK